ncbi:MAG: haloacid dehalogenase [Chloroflexi bacterium]|nr:haloacid dehalogenase [Chloroflexota bacterium]
MRQILDRMEQRNSTREEVLRYSRQLVQYSSRVIRAAHREEEADAQALLHQARELAGTMRQTASHFPELYYAGYTQDALKEFSEASIVTALIRGDHLPYPSDLGVEDAAYLNGLAEAASEMRRHTLDCIRRGEISQAERSLESMDEIYGFLVTVDFPDAITGGLRRNTDLVRGVTERTRGDLTLAVRQEELQKALEKFEKRTQAGQP